MKDDALPTAPSSKSPPLVALRMPRALEMLDTWCAARAGQLSPLEAIEALLAEELTIREGRRIRAALQIARLTPKTLAGFDFTFQPSLDRNRITALAQLDFIRRHEIVHFLGPPGTGNSSRHRPWRRGGRPAQRLLLHRSPTSSTAWPGPSGKAGCASASVLCRAPAGR